MNINIKIVRNIAAYLIEKDNMKFSYSKQILTILNNNHSETNELEIPQYIIESLCKYCETQAIYDKLGKYGDFYYKIKRLTF